ncbi:MAG TPA: hypothetical protein VK970_25660 [Candidatus Methylacidiphilales bacterium]|nr:hypothetical protein [Candidatus Methylacidiphilales bacterium]
MLALFVPGTMHCLPGANAQIHLSDVLQIACGEAQDQNCCAETTSHGAPASSNEAEHPCATQTLEHTQLPTVLKAPAQPQGQLDDDATSQLWALNFAALLHHVHAALNAADSCSVSEDLPGSPAQLRAGWAFRTRAALPARMPSDLV